MKGYRFVTEKLTSQHGDVQWAIGKWKKCQGKLSLCENGFHASQKPIDSLSYIFGSRWFECEARGKILIGDYFIEGKWYDRTTYDIPDEIKQQYKTTTPCWKKNIIKV